MLQQKVLPTQIATSRLIVFSKVKGEFPKPEQTRPITSLSPIMKIIEALIMPELQKTIENNNIVPVLQLGFKKKCSTAMNLILLITEMLESV